MKTIGKSITAVFAAIGLAALAAAICGETHQCFVFGICAFVLFVKYMNISHDE